MTADSVAGMHPKKSNKYRWAIVLIAAVLGAAVGGLSLWLPLRSDTGGGVLIFNPFPSGKMMSLVGGSFGAIVGCVSGAVIGFLMQAIVFYGRRS